MSYSTRGIVDVGASCADLSSYRLRAVSANLSVNGFFVDISGNRAGIPFSGVVPWDNSLSFQALYEASVADPVATPYPANAVGFVGMFDCSASDLAFDIVGQATDVPTGLDVDVTAYPHAPYSGIVTFGRVANR